MASPARIAPRDPDLIILKVGENESGERYIHWYDPKRKVEGIDAWVGHDGRAIIPAESYDVVYLNFPGPGRIDG